MKSRAHFKGIRYNIMTTNNAESLNSLFKNAWEFPVLAMVEQIRKTLQKWFYEIHIEVEKGTTTLTPPIEDKMHKKYDDAKGLIVVPINVYELLVGVENEMYIVNLEARTCNCREYNLEKLPCTYALLATKFKGISFYSLCSPYYTSTSWKQAYAECIYPLDVYDVSNTVVLVFGVKPLPPDLKRHLLEVNSRLLDQNNILAFHSYRCYLSTFWSTVGEHFSRMGAIF
ncbi:uncharacterized protein LOC111409552 [Olea europaea var. sylvestris]|uniref:uncharacterized protein LOC111409552 n=1 Tax=Olea europaea var. sylvestris TaxID=158386 RepID=UPI000C1D2D3F|nr:uncharacterized protein LOC111409552 [Olea europaea var. sylvestris]